ncbi:MAG TPA: glutamate cyclase domain-containing protein [Planctomycetaceae bacterium]|nr:glutamate cyclase domain-containing protein [Planctomycetaceae bacterium]
MTLLTDIDRVIRRDPAARGLISSEPQYGPLGAGQLQAAAEDLAQHASCVVLVTGFFVPRGDPPAAETDGPPGTLLLAQALEAIGVETRVLTDEFCVSAVAAAAAASGYAREKLLVWPRVSDEWLVEFFERGPGRRMSHLIALERVGPSHTQASFLAQRRTADPPIDMYRERVPPESHGRCHNMRGEIIDEQTAGMERLFEDVRRYRPQAKTIGVGDGGNEIGMGAILWEDLVRRLEGAHSARIPCRVATDWLIVAGTSNWGGYALAAATLALRGAADALAPWDGEHQRRVLEQMVEHGPAVDGVTGRREATVDGLPFLTYIQPWEGIRRLLGLT